MCVSFWGVLAEVEGASSVGSLASEGAARAAKGPMPCRSVSTVESHNRERETHI